MTNDQRKISTAKSRPQRTSVVFDRRNSNSSPQVNRRNSNNSPQVNRRNSNNSPAAKRRNSDKGQPVNRRGRSADFKVENSDGVTTRRSSTTFFTGATQEVFTEHEDADYRERYRNVLRELYAEQDLEKRQIYQREFQMKIKLRQKEQLNVGRSRVVKFIRYLATEHETLLPVLIFMPLVLASLYIVLIEKSPLIKYGNS